MPADPNRTLARLWAGLWDAERAALVAWFSREGVLPQAAAEELDDLAAQWAAELRGYVPAGTIGPKAGRSPVPD